MREILIDKKDARHECFVPLGFECPRCGGELQKVEEAWCSSYDLYLECKKCGRQFKEVWAFERAYEVVDE